MTADINTVAPNGVVDLSGAPGALDDATFDSLFPAEAQTVAVAATTQSNTQGTTQQQTPVVQQTTAQPNAPFLKGQKSVYNTPEDALAGINKKDELIDQLRQRYSLATGIDPITGQPVGQVQAQVQQSNYYSNPEQYLNDLYAAAKSGGPEDYRNVQAKFVTDTLAPIQPLLQKAARDQAVTTLKGEIADADTFIGSPQYDAALAANPELKTAITAAETNMQWHSRLSGLYKLAYLTGKGMQLPEILKTQASQTQTSNSQTQVRPTAQSTTIAAPTQTTQPNLKTLAGIKNVVQDFESRGFKLEF